MNELKMFYKVFGGVIFSLFIFSACVKDEANNNNVFFVPNTFSPDGNQYNSEFLPILSNNYTLSSYYLVVRSRNGETIFESLDVLIGWDGTFKNEFVQSGVYVWEIRFTASNSTEKQLLSGYVSLLR